MTVYHDELTRLKEALHDLTVKTRSHGVYAGYSRASGIISALWMLHSSDIDTAKHWMVKACFDMAVFDIELGLYAEELHLKATR